MKVAIVLLSLLLTGCIWDDNIKPPPTTLLELKVDAKLLDTPPQIEPL